MRFIRLLGITVIVYGLSYLMYGTMQFLGMVNYSASLQLIGLNFSIGAISVAIGVGLLLAKEWARVAWLAASTMLLAEHVFFLALFYLTGELPPLQVMNVILIILLFLIAWSKLTRTSVKEHFR